MRASTRVNTSLGCTFNKAANAFTRSSCSAKCKRETLAGDRLNTADTGTDGAFAKNPHKADIAGRRNMRTTAKLDRLRLASLAPFNTVPMETTRTSIAILLAK